MPEIQPLRCAVFGGSFDPIHLGHVGVASRCQEAFQLERIAWIPAAQPPHKLGRSLAEPPMRLAMCMIATAHEPSWEVLPIELAREGPSYTYDTLLEVPDHLRPWLVPKKDGGFAPRKRDLELFLILGSDNLEGLPRWKNAEDVVSMTQPIVVWRADEGGATPESLLEGLSGRMSEGALDRLRRGFLELPPLPQSSTAIRAALERGEVIADALHPEVLEFIQEKGLYGWSSAAPEADMTPASGSASGDQPGTARPRAEDPLGGDPADWTPPRRGSAQERA